MPLLVFEERHFPLYAPLIDYYLDDGDEPPWTWLRRGMPYQLQGFGYDGLHEMWDGTRDGISALTLLVKPPDAFYTEPDRIRVAWLESGSAHIPQETLLRIPEGGIPPDVLTEATTGTRFEGAAQAGAWVWAETDNLFLDACYEDGTYDGFSDPWEEEIIEQATQEWRRAEAIMDSAIRLADWLEEDLAGHFAEMLDFILGRLPNQYTEVKDH